MDSNTSGSFFFRGTAKIFLSTFTGLLSGDVDLSASVIGAALARVEPRRAHQYYEFIRFDAHEMPDGTLVRWYMPEKANLGAVALEIVEKFRARGYVVDADATPQAGTEPAPAGMVGADEKTAERLEAVRGWPEAKRRGMRRCDYCAQYSIDESTLTKWRAALKKQGYDVPDFA